MRGSTGRGREFAWLVVGDMGGGDVGDMLSGLDQLVEAGLADPDRIGIMGLSYGGFMACWLPTQDARFKASVAMSPVTTGTASASAATSEPGSATSSTESRSPRAAVLRPQPRALRRGGSHPDAADRGHADRATPPGQAIEFHNALVEQGVATDVVVYPGEGHGVHSFPALIDCTTRVVAWFEQHMPAKA